MSSCLLSCILSTTLIYLVSAKEQWIFQPEKKWDREWASGAWKYQEKVPVERSRIAVIGGVLVQMYAPFANSTVLEIGCGEGAVADFLTPGQVEGYVGVDISKEAIAIAKTKRKTGGIRFVHAAAHKFQPGNKFDVIIFSEMEGKPKYENIFKYAQTKFQQVDEIEVSGKTKKWEVEKKAERTAFRIEVYRVKTKT